MTEIMFLLAYFVLLNITYAKQNFSTENNTPRSGIITGISVRAKPPELTEKSGSRTLYGTAVKSFNLGLG